MVMRSRVSDDVGADLVAQAVAVAADIVVVPDGPLAGEELAAGVLVVVVPGRGGGAGGGAGGAGGGALGDAGGGAGGAGGGALGDAGGGAGGGALGGASAAVVVLVSEGPNGAAAVEVGARIAVSRRCPLRLVPATGSRELVRLAFARAEELGSIWAARAARTVHGSLAGRLDCEVSAGPADAASLIVAAINIRHLAGNAGACPVLLVREH